MSDRLRLPYVITASAASPTNETDRQDLAPDSQNWLVAFIWRPLASFQSMSRPGLMARTVDFASQKKASCLTKNPCRPMSIRGTFCTCQAAAEPCQHHGRDGQENTAADPGSHQPTDPLSTAALECRAAPPNHTCFCWGSSARLPRWLTLAYRPCFGSNGLHTVICTPEPSRGIKSDA